MDEDLFFVRGRNLFGYNITIYHIRLKCYDLYGNILWVKLFRWYPKLYDIRFNVVDLFCVALKGKEGEQGIKQKLSKMARVFFVDDP